MRDLNVKIVFISVIISFCSLAFAQIPGNVLFLDGNKAGLLVKDIDSSLDSLSTQLTIEAGVDLVPPFNSNFPRIVDRSDNLNDDRFLFLIDLVNGGPSLNINKNPVSADTLIFNKWMHVAGTFDGHMVKIYVNGKTRTELYSPTVISVNASDLYIGNNELNNRAFHGAIDEVRIWNKARTQSQIQRTMHRELGPEFTDTPDSGLIAYWKFNSFHEIKTENDTVLQIDDISKNKNNGIILGNADVISSQPQVHTLTDFSLLEPKNGATTETTNPEFKWEQASDKTVFYPSELRYILYLDDNYEFLSPRIEEIDGDTSCVIPNLESGRTYFWKILAQNVVGDTLWSNNTNGFFITKLTGVREKNGPLVNNKFSLFQNYPNPFNSSTFIGYYLPVESHVNIKIFDISGRLVDIIEDRNQTPGRHTARWNPNTVGSGVYFYRIQFGNGKSLIKKCLLIK
ncbi:MAG: T9SS type A sorting domain-containing protein [Calditrichia bacterium]